MKSSWGNTKTMLITVSSNPKDLSTPHYTSLKVLPALNTVTKKMKIPPHQPLEHTLNKTQP